MSGRKYLTPMRILLHSFMVRWYTMGMKYIQLTQGKKTKVDDEDFAYLNRLKWFYKKDGYASRGIWDSERKVRGTMRMHTLILGKVPDGLQVDHINRDTLDNRRGNLRLCTVSQNAQNRKVFRTSKSGLKGVVDMRYSKQYANAKKCWRAMITLNRKRKFLGYFHTKEDAAIAYNNAAKRMYGEFAVLNKI